MMGALYVMYQQGLQCQQDIPSLMDGLGSTTDISCPKSYHTQSFSVVSNTLHCDHILAWSSSWWDHYHVILMKRPESSPVLATINDFLRCNTGADGLMQLVNYFLDFR